MLLQLSQNVVMNLNNVEMITRNPSYFVITFKSGTTKIGVSTDEGEAIQRWLESSYGISRDFMTVDPSSIDFLESVSETKDKIKAQIERYEEFVRKNSLDTEGMTHIGEVLEYLTEDKEIEIMIASFDNIGDSESEDCE